MGKIAILDRRVYEKIAAGEVVENPLSVVKELVENSLDAGADRIDIELTGGGKNLIVVTDNGTGFSADDIEPAFMRHSTSKFREFSDFETLSTLGFRGEALPSILEVSEIELITSDNESGRGIFCKFKDGEVQEKTEIPSDRGSRISVSSLFYNLPVRKKFLKGDRAELNRIVSYLEKVVLSNHDKTFSLLHNGKEVFYFERTEKLENRVYQVIGKDLASKMIPLDYSLGNYKIRGLVSGLNQGAVSKKNQYFFVNGRTISERTLYAALNNSYKNFLEKSMSPAAIILFEIPPAEVDVNIHPTKLEIKFEDSQKVYRFINRAIKSLFQDDMILPEKSIDKFSWDRSPGKKGEDLQSVSNVNESADLKPLFKNTELNGDGFSVIGQYKNSYIIIEKNNSLVVVDQHNADERSNFDKLQAGYNAGEIETVSPLFPIILDLSPAESGLISTELSEKLKRAGFEISILSGNSADVKKYPGIIPENEVKDTLKKILAGDTTIDNYEGKILADIACKSSIKVNYRLNHDQMRKVVKRLYESSNPYFCPHKRPIIIEFQLEKIEKLLKRR